MKKTKLTHKMWAKILAVILLVLTILTAIAGAAGVFLCYENGIYADLYGRKVSFYDSPLYGNIVSSVDNTFWWNYGWDEAGPGFQTLLDLHYPTEHTNLVIRIYDDATGEILLAANHPEPIQVHSDSIREFPLSSQGHPDDYYVYVAVAQPLVNQYDSVSYAIQEFNFLRSVRYIAIIAVGCSALIFLISLIFLFCSVGHRADVEGIHLTWVDKIPLDLLAAGCICLAAIFYTGYTDILGWGGVEFFTLVFCCVLAFWFLLSFAARCKAGNPFKNTLIVRIWKLALRIFRALGRVLRSFYRALPMLWKTVLILIALAFLELLLIGGIVNGNGFVIVLFLIVNLALVTAVIFAVWQLIMLKKAGKELASGNFDHKVNTGKMYWEFRQHGENLNSIGLGMALAVEQRTRSERLKTELITNVSHDIKTPLTSIINYVDLLQRPDVTEEERTEYLDVLARQSHRLKKLTEDLVEASKASTGNMSVTLVPTSVKELLDQAVAEYGERLHNSKLEPVIYLSDKDLTVMADGRLLWRVMDNLLNNVCKYALPGTRVYLDARQKGEQVVFSVKNVSRDPLNVSEEELMERFVRGDDSRHTEGSGLGLNIARSLTELQNGSFRLTIDGDLFKAEITLHQ